MRALGVNARELLVRAEAWRPFRAYAAMYLWTMDIGEPSRARRGASEQALPARMPMKIKERA
jgi:3-methyladenine DNA glycosylase/8-oxoguanine DNA glycosylase